MAWFSKQPATTIAEDQMVPICKLEVKKAHGAWKPVHILVDQIAIEAGFSKSSYQAQSLTIEEAGETCRFVHVTKKNKLHGL